LDQFHPSKLHIEYRDGVTPYSPVIPRKYTLTHRDETGELFLTIGSQFAWDQINPESRDEVLGEWRCIMSFFVLHLYLFLDGRKPDLSNSLKRLGIFRRELPLALKSLRYGDRVLLYEYPFLDFAPIYVHFISSFPELAKQEYWGFLSLFEIDR